MKKIILLLMMIVLAFNVFAADATINDLSAIGSGNIVDGDKFHIWDISASVGTRDKNSLASTLRAYIFGSGFSLSGKLTGAAYEIEGSNFDINGGTVDGVSQITTTGNVGINNASPTRALDISGTFFCNGASQFTSDVIFSSNAEVYQQLIHNGDSDTYIDFGASSTDQIDIYAGGIRFISYDETTQDVIKFGNGVNDIDYWFLTPIGTTSMFIQGSSGNVAVGHTDPKTKIDVHHNPTGLSNNTGGGDVVTFGVEDGTEVLSAGKIYYLATTGIWKYADADTESESGPVMLGIALGTSISDGLLLRGYFDAFSYLNAYSSGKVIYVDTIDGEMDTTAPSGTNDVVRAIGWCCPTSNVIYFNPDGAYDIPNPL